MKNNIKKELHNKSVSELRVQLKEAKEAQRVLRLDQEMGKLKNTSSLGNNRAEIAVISTIINEKVVEARIEQTVKVEGERVKPASAKATAGKGGKNE